MLLRYPWKLTKLEDPEARVAQSVALVRQLPAIIFGNGFAAIIAYFALQAEHPPIPATLIPASILLLLVPMFLSWRRLRKRSRPTSVSVRRIRNLILYSGFLGCLWAALELIYLPGASFSVVALLTAASGFLGVGEPWRPFS